MALNPERPDDISKSGLLSLADAVRAHGGIREEDFQHHLGKEWRESGLKHLARKHGAFSFDDLAQMLHNEGHINVPEGEIPGHYLMDQLRAGAPSLHTAGDQYEREAEETLRRYMAEEQARSHPLGDVASEGNGPGGSASFNIAKLEAEQPIRAPAHLKPATFGVGWGERPHIPISGFGSPSNFLNQGQYWAKIARPAPGQEDILRVRRDQILAELRERRRARYKLAGTGRVITDKEDKRLREQAAELALKQHEKEMAAQASGDSTIIAPTVPRAAATPLPGPDSTITGGLPPAPSPSTPLHGLAAQIAALEKQEQEAKKQQTQELLARLQREAIELNEQYRQRDVSRLALGLPAQDNEKISLGQFQRNLAAKMPRHHLGILPPFARIGGNLGRLSGGGPPKPPKPPVNTAASPGDNGFGSDWDDLAKAVGIPQSALKRPTAARTPTEDKEKLPARDAADALKELAREAQIGATRLHRFGNIAANLIQRGGQGVLGLAGSSPALSQTLHGSTQLMRGELGVIIAPTLLGLSGGLQGMARTIQHMPQEAQRSLNQLAVGTLAMTGGMRVAQMLGISGASRLGNAGIGRFLGGGIGGWSMGLAALGLVRSGQQGGQGLVAVEHMAEQLAVSFGHLLRAVDPAIVGMGRLTETVLKIGTGGLNTVNTIGNSVLGVGGGGTLLTALATAGVGAWMMRGRAGSGAMAAMTGKGGVGFGGSLRGAGVFAGGGLALEGIGSGNESNWGDWAKAVGGGALTGAVLGAGTGPGALVTGAIGAVVGAMGYFLTQKLSGGSTNNGSTNNGMTAPPGVNSNEWNRFLAVGTGFTPRSGDVSELHSLYQSDSVRDPLQQYQLEQEIRILEQMERHLQTLAAQQTNYPAAPTGATF